MGFVKFMSSSVGRALRFAIGAVLLMWGIAVASWILIVLGLFFMAVGALDICVFAPLFKMPLSGKKVRALNK